MLDTSREGVAGRLELTERLDWFLLLDAHALDDLRAELVRTLTRHERLLLGRLHLPRDDALKKRDIKITTQTPMASFRSGAAYVFAGRLSVLGGRNIRRLDRLHDRSHQVARRLNERRGAVQLQERDLTISRSHRKHNRGIGRGHSPQTRSTLH